MNKLTMSLALVSILALGFTGCGDSSDGDDPIDNLINSVDIVDASSLLTAATSYSCDETRELGGKTYTMKIGATNQLSTDCTYGQLTFADDDTNEIIISQYTKTTAVSGELHDGITFKAVMDVNFEKGTEHTVGTSSEYGAFDCTTTYDVVLPITIYDADEANLYIDDFQLTNSTCPDWLDDETEEEEEPKEMTMVENISITQAETNEVSKISSYMSIK